MIINKIKLMLLFTVTTFLFSCTLNNEPGKAENESSVIFNLVANKSTQKLYIYRIADLEEDREPYGYDSLYLYGGGYGTFFIKNAEVQLESQNLLYNNFALKEYDGNSGFDKGFQYISDSSLTIFPNTKYSLLIDYDGINIFGETTTPGDFEIISPKNNTIFKAAFGDDKLSFKIEWSKSNNAKGYFIQIIQTDLSYYSSLSFITTDTTYNYLQHTYWGNYRLEVLAYDKNFHNYLIEEYSQSGLENSYGYFGSSVLKSIDFKVR